MAISWSDVPVPINVGLDNRTSDLVSTSPGQIVNLVWDREGSLSKRDGFTALGATLLSGTDNSRGLDPITQLAVRYAMDGHQDLVAITSGTVASFISGSNLWDWRSDSRRMSVDTAPFSVGNNTMLGASMATQDDGHGNGISVLAWVEAVSGTITTGLATPLYRQRACVLDSRTHDILVQPFYLTTANSQYGIAPRVMPFNGSVRILFIDNDASDSTLGLKVKSIAPANPWVGASAAATTLDSSFRHSSVVSPFDAVPWVSSVSGSLIAAAGLIDATTIRLNLIDANLNVVGKFFQTPNAGESITNIYSLTCIDGNRPYILYSSVPPLTNVGTVFGAYGDFAGNGIPLNAGSTEHAIYVGQNANLLPGGNTPGLTTAQGVGNIPGDASGSVVLYAVGGSGSNGNSVDWYLEFHGQQGDINGYAVDDNRRMSYIRKLNQSTSTVAEKGNIRHCELATHPFFFRVPATNELHTFLGVTTYADDQSHHLIISGGYAEAFVTSSVWARFEEGTAYPSAFLKPRVSTGSIGPDVFQAPFQLRGRLEAANGLSFNRGLIGLATVDLDPPPVQSCQALGSLVLGGGLPRFYDGQRVVELGFNYFPALVGLHPTNRPSNNWPSIVALNQGTGGVPAGTYYYVATYHWLDADGREHRSAPDFGEISEPIAVQAVFSYNYQINVPTLSFTDKDDVRIKVWRTQNGGSTFFLVSSGSWSELRNDPGANYVSFVDSSTDTAIDGNEVLYTVGGELENVPPPSFGVLTQWNGRAWGVADDGLTLWYSKGLSSQLAPEFNDGLTIDIPPDGGHITALAPMDEKLVVFKRDRMYIITGDGPDATGGNGSFSLPTIITSEVGCLPTEQGGGVAVPVNGLGVAFRSAKGIYMLGRDLNIAFVGQGVQDLVKQAPALRAIVPLDALNRVDFVFANAGPGSSQMLSFDTVLGRWTQVSSSLPTDGAVAWNGTEVIGGLNNSTTGLAFQSTSGSCLDNGNPFSFLYQTPWIAAANAQGFERVKRLWVLGHFQSPHLISGTVDFDYLANGPQSYSFGAASSVFATGSIEQFTHDLHTQKCQALRLTIFDDLTGQSVGTDQSTTIDSLRFRLGVKDGGARVGPSKKIP